MRTQPKFKNENCLAGLILQKTFGQYFSLEVHSTFVNLAYWRKPFWVCCKMLKSLFELTFLGLLLPLTNNNTQITDNTTMNFIFQRINCKCRTLTEYLLKFETHIDSSHPAIYLTSFCCVYYRTFLISCSNAHEEWVPTGINKTSISLNN